MRRVRPWCLPASALSNTDFHPEKVLFALIGVLSGFPAAAYKSTPHRKPLCGLDQNKKPNFLNWKSRICFVNRIKGDAMKKIICLILVLGVVVMVGCAQEKPEVAAKKIFEQQVAGHEGIELDTSGLVYTIVEQGDNSALVEVSGNMAVKAAIPLVEKKGQWVLDMPAVETSGEVSAAH
jgi:hypothetical protein